MRRRLLVRACIVMVLVACGREAPPASTPPPATAPEQATIRVLAAASLVEVLPPIAEQFEQATGARVELQFGASSMLAEQIRSGIDCDAFVAADPRWTQFVIDQRLGDASTRRVIATNRLVAIVPADAATAPSTLAELAALPHIAVAGAEVPAGMHARTALERSGALVVAEPHFVSAADVRAALAWVARGEAEAGLVYATDARSEPRVRVAFVLGPESHEPIRYEATATSPEPGEPVSQRGRAFVDHLGSAAARGALEAAGFGPPR